jgi:hypothetical protein
MGNPSQAHYNTALHVVSYLKSTTHHGICYQSRNTNSEGASCDLIGYTDASHMSESDSLRSVSGFAFILNSGVISYQSKLQTTVAMSTAESEYMAINMSGREGVWLRYLMHELYRIPYTQHKPLYLHVGEQVPAEIKSANKSPEAMKSAQLIYTDSQSALAMIKNCRNNKTTKHIEKIYHWSREKVDSKHLTFAHIPGDDNIADIFTKPLAKPKFEKFRDLMGMLSLDTFLAL